jgi:hypothetical protein
VSDAQYVPYQIMQWHCDGNEHNDIGACRRLLSRVRERRTALPRNCLVAMHGNAIASMIYA